MQTCQKEKTKAIQTRLRNESGAIHGEVPTDGESSAIGGLDEAGEQLNVFICPEEDCGYRYPSFKGVQAHYRSAHKGALYAQEPSFPICCGRCEYSFPTIRSLCSHVRDCEDHWDPEGRLSTMPYSISKITFGSGEEFLEWKEKIESETDTEFIRNSRYVGKSWTKVFFHCSRSGWPLKSVEEEEMAARPGKRAPSRLPSKKIGYHCTSFIQSRKMDDG
ncbi:MAG: hypothetical protein GY820_30390 [Gammaproteobacteria bacterium]|nr:hypothetical protein [Gammaproteobacteria bacterium]